LLTGRSPVEGDTITEMIANSRDKMPEPPKKFQLAVNEMFQDVVMKLLAKNPDHRFATSSDLLQDLLKIGKFNSLDPRL
jgi:serine/threonine protein kinase